MQKQIYVVTNEQGLFYTEAGNNSWSADLTLARKYDCPEEASAIARLENAFVVPHSC